MAPAIKSAIPELSMKNLKRVGGPDSPIRRDTALRAGESNLGSDDSP